MGKKFKITEDQLKRLVENKDKAQMDPVIKPDEEVSEIQLNESVNVYKSDFDRYLKGPKQ